MTKNLLAILLGVLVSMLALLILEGGVRLFRSDINHQDTERALFMERKFGNSFGWLPNVSGVSFGQRFYTDKDGFRKPERQPDSGKSWVILGDSVAFGVGVENDNTFISLMQEARPDIRILNTAVVGYATENYRDVLLKFASESDVTHVVLFYCLNDIYDAMNVLPEKQGGVERVLGFLRRNSKLYMLMKNILSDRSKTFLQNDFHEYEESNPRFIRTVRLLTEINDILTKRKISFQVVMLPDEYQLRKREQGLLKPQETIA